jgi:hypothetical protein
MVVVWRMVEGPNETEAPVSGSPSSGRRARPPLSRVAAAGPRRPAPHCRSVTLGWCAALALSACTEAGAPVPDDPGATALPTQARTGRRLRRLSNYEIENVLADLLGTRLDLTRGFLRDPRVEGYDNDAIALGVSESKVDELRTAAERAAAFMTRPDRLAQFAPCSAGQDRAGCARNFAVWVAIRAWGRAPATDELDRLEVVYRAGTEGGDYGTGIELVAEALLEAPGFLFRSELGEGPDQRGQSRLAPWEIASAMSFLLVGSRPDAALFVSAPQLLHPERREEEARRLMATPAARRHLRGFLRAWLGLSDVALISKDQFIFPLFTPSVRSAIDRELDTFLDYVITARGGRLDELMVADYSFPGPALAPIYNDDLLEPIGDFTRVHLGPRRRGLLSSPAFLASNGLINETNPVQRGLLVRTRALCQDVAPPPPSVNAVTPPGSAMTTTRSKYAAHSADPFCRACHQLMDPIGFGLEAFDTLGRHRTEEGGQPIDATGALVGTDVDGPFSGPAELSEKLATSAEFRRCFVKQLWRFAEGRSAEAADDAEVDALTARFTEAEDRIGELLVSLIKRPTFIVRQAGEVTP